MEKMRFIELVKALNEEQIVELVKGINGVSHEWGWSEEMEETDLIKECWKNS